MTRGLVCLAMASLVLTGCQSEFLFRQDHRVTVMSPGSFSHVRQPVEVTWTARDFSAPRDGSFAVFVDRDPMPPGESLNYFDQRSRSTHIWVVTSPRLRIDSLPARGGISGPERNHHDLTVVLLDTSGRRVSETTGFTEFDVIP